MMSLIRDSTQHGLIAERFWWPAMHGDIAWFIRTCRLCQLRQTRNVLIPPVVANPAPLFESIQRHNAPSQVNGCKYIVPNRILRLVEAANLTMNEPCSRARRRPLLDLSTEHQHKMQRKHPHWEPLCRQCLKRTSLYGSGAVGAVAID